MLNDDDLSDELQDDSAAIATIGISPMEFTNQDSIFWYFEGDTMVDEAECEALVPATPGEIKSRSGSKLDTSSFSISRLI